MWTWSILLYRFLINTFSSTSYHYTLLWGPNITIHHNITISKSYLPSLNLVTIINATEWQTLVVPDQTAPGAVIWAVTRQNQQNDCVPSEDSDQPGHPPSPIRVFAVRMKKAWVLSYPLSAQRRLWSDLVDAQADLSLRWAHMPFLLVLTWGGSY